MVDKFLHRLAPKYYCSRSITRKLVYNFKDSDTKVCMHYHGYFITRIVLGTVALFFGIVFLVM